MEFTPRERPDVELVAGAIVSFMAAEHVTTEDTERHPDFAHCGVMQHLDRRYVVLRNAGEHTLAVYRVQNSGQLRKMRRPPTEVTTSPTG